MSGSMTLVGAVGTGVGMMAGSVIKDTAESLGVLPSEDAGKILD